MLQHDASDHTAFEATLYHQDVRAAVNDNRHHPFFSDHWADIKIQSLLAQDEDEAYQLITERYPPEEGFVVEELAALN
jgi:hypothetical protein